MREVMHLISFAVTPASMQLYIVTDRHCLRSPALQKTPITALEMPQTEETRRLEPSRHVTPVGASFSNPSRREMHHRTCPRRRAWPWPLPSRGAGHKQPAA